MKNGDCIFCKIFEGSIPSTKVFESGKVMAFKDLRPHATKHFLFIHKEHTSDLGDLMVRDPGQVEDIFKAITEFARKEGLSEQGYRVVNNIGPNAGQTVFHTHFHVLGGEPLGSFGS